MLLNKKLNRGFTFILILISVFIHSQGYSQIYGPEGLNMPGAWDDWTNPPANIHLAGSSQTSNGHVKLLELQSPIYQTRFYVSNADGDLSPGEYQFKFTSGPMTSIWQNQWGNTTVQFNTIQEYTYGAGGTDEPEPNNITLNENNWYVMNWDNIGYENTRAVFMQLEEEAVEIISLSQFPILPAATDQVEISISTSAAPTAQEYFYLNYTTNDWQSSELLPFEMNSNNGIATIPAFSDGVEIEYYAFSSIQENLVSDINLWTISVENNNNENYEYEVGGELNCGSSLALVGTQPAFPLENSDVILTFNAELGNGGLAGYEGDVYVHAGLITNLSTSASDWKYVLSEWGENTVNTKLDRIDDDLYEWNITNVREYFEVPSGEEIQEIALVFRSDEPVGSGYLEGKTVDNQDIYTPVYKDELNVKITYPSSDDPLMSPNAIFPVCVSSLQADGIHLNLDGSLLSSTQDENMLYGLNTTELSAGSHWIIANAYDGSNEVSDSVMIFIRGDVNVQDLPDGLKPGVNYINDESVTLVLQDPAKLKQFAFVIGDFNDWMVSDDGYMNRTPDGEFYWITLNGLEANKEYAYQFYIDGEIKIADPYSEKILDPWNDKWIPAETYPNLKDYPFGKATGIVSVFETAQEEYPWVIENFVPSAINETQSNLVIYELLIRDFVGDSRIASVTDSIEYLKNLGVNAIELMPINEFEGNDSWGYNPSFYFAPDKAYGTKEDYKEFIDVCHQNGIAVILDVVFNHSFGQSPLAHMYWDASLETTSSQNPWYNQYATHPFSPGYDFNHESPHTRSFVKEALAFWVEEFKVDGYRFDLSKGFTQTNSGQDVGYWSQYDQSRVNILNDYYQSIKDVNPNTYVILEHLANNDEEVALANAGMMLWAKMTDEFNQATMGYQDQSDFSYAYFNERGFTYPNLIPFMESHDEERLMYKNLEYGNSSGDYDITELSTSLERISAIAPLYIMVPGPKMIWQFGELGYDYSINHCPDGTVSEDCRTSKKPIEWDYYYDIERQKVYQTFAAMLKLKNTQDAFPYGEYSKDLGGSVKRSWISHSSLNVCAAGNFDVEAHDVIADFQHEGLWYNYMTGEELQVSNGQSIELQAGEFYVFTNQDFGRPYVQLDLTVLREEDNSPIHGAIVTIDEVGSTTTSMNGEVSFLPLSNKDYNYTIKAGNITHTGVFNIEEEDIEQTIKIQNVDAVSTEVFDLVKLYPNPSNGKFIIENAFGAELELYNLRGQLILNKYIDKPRFNISLEGLSQGIYMIQLKNSNNFLTKKLIIK